MWVGWRGRLGTAHWGGPGRCRNTGKQGECGGPVAAAAAGTTTAMIRQILLKQAADRRGPTAPEQTTVVT